ncbi:twin-arginine translocase subunit TatC [Tenuibacillus multivorans]|uniref:Sec-independent protein translocase protein TatC n=1 Tax=Tenuibacillus multivorans TaxID=237069 RepID=A0A1H0CQ94_9BACI|nr:twin-arginine translocase subunit TatC [Tenuibacillus multivorans]GEL76207.1 Sec-independent protein translocase protein TatC [Tenuibacillus multivorans]SDN60054.1 sec-independent protein translocase protein TatC [Tenuibacillus multivorans]
MEEKTNQEQEVMDWTEHLGELRKRLIWSLIIFIISFGAGFFYVEEIYRFIERDVSFTLTVLGPFEIIWIYVIIATVTGLLVTLPFLAFQLWSFISPGLTSHERKVSLLYIPAIFILFLLGLLFGYFIIKDLILNFLLDLADGLVNEMFTANNYFRFILQITLPFAIFFEVPLIAMFLTSLGIISPGFMKKTRKYAYLILVILGTMLSPPDFILQLVVAVPLIILYEISITMSSIVYRRRVKKLGEET